jgi:hypothetical protein
MHIFFFFSKITISTYSNIIFFNFFFYSLNHSNIISYLFSGIHNYDKKKKKKKPTTLLAHGSSFGRGNDFCTCITILYINPTSKRIGYEIHVCKSHIYESHTQYILI